MTESLEHSWPVILSSALALAIIASIDALLCAKLTSQPGELRGGDDRLLVRLGVANAVSAAFGGITSGINIGPSLANRAFGGRSWLSVIVNAVAVLATATLLFPLLAYIPRAVLSAAIMVVAIQHIDPWTRQLAARLVARGTPQRGVIALDLGVSVFVSLLSIAINVVLAVFIGIALAVLLFVVRMSGSNVRKAYRCDTVRSRRYRDPAELAVLHVQGASILVIELQGALFFGSAERLAQIVDGETAAGTSALVLELRRVTEIDSTGARILGDLDAALTARGVKLSLVLSGRTETAARLAGIFHAPDRFFPDIDRAIEWPRTNCCARPEPDRRWNCRFVNTRWSANSPPIRSSCCAARWSQWRGRPAMSSSGTVIPGRRFISSRRGAPAFICGMRTATSAS
jgi:MFS superfamily sulfate permease-like transporter